MILSDVLVPYWNAERIGFVEDDADVSGGGEHDKPDSDAPNDPLYIRLAEELIVIRYVALIRSVLVNIRFLMLFVSSAFVLAIIAWNSYPFQPHQLIDWCFTLLLIFLGIGFVWLLAQMHRNAILSRITDTIPNQLVDYLRIVTFGAVQSSPGLPSFRGWAGPFGSFSLIYGSSSSWSRRQNHEARMLLSQSNYHSRENARWQGMTG